MRRGTKAGLAATALVVGALWLGNTSLLAPHPQGTPIVLAHRGVHQTFRRAGIDRQATCTARRIFPPTNPYLENTLPSMKASFAAGADMLELDVHPTTDGEFAVFHDWTLDCRTNGHGETRAHSMAYLKRLDVGYGYTADGGRSWPFRGRGVGLMPTLEEVLHAFPNRRFLINIKSNDPTETDRLIAYLKARHHPTDGRLWVLAAKRPAARLLAIAPQARLFSVARIKRCTYDYMLWGWSGHVPDACRHGIIAVPTDLRRALWGWPNRFLARMKAADVAVMIAGPVRGPKPRETGLVSPDQLAAVPPGFSGLILTDHVERIGPAAKARWGAPGSP